MPLQTFALTPRDTIEACLVPGATVALLSVMRPASFIVKASLRALPRTGACDLHFLAPRVWCAPSHVGHTYQASRLGGGNGTYSLNWKRRFATDRQTSASGPDEKPTGETEEETRLDRNRHGEQDSKAVMEEQTRASKPDGIAQASEQLSATNFVRGSPSTPANSSSSTMPPPLPPSSPHTPSSGDASIHANGELNNVNLPSHTAGNRSVIVARFHATMERLLEKITIASQRVNTYTGTDYSGIETLRAAIKNLEALVKTKLALVTAAKEQHHSALAAQSSSQKEVVQLLERKHSWAPPDLERYMALIRSEHVNDQAVQAAKDAILQSERELEEVRAKLERYERRQYHEEQIWSDTIRRNSTWVTFGLMGFNILLLIFSLIAIEPWRRQRLVTEMKKALDEKTIAGTNVVTAAGSTVREIHEPEQIATPPEAIQMQEVPPNTTPVVLETGSGPTTIDIPVPVAEAAAPGLITPLRPSALISSPSFTLWGDTWSSTFDGWRLYWADMFSERSMAVRRVDLTAAALEGAAAGAAFMGLLFVLLRPK